MSQKLKITPQFGKNLRSLRKQHEFTQEELVIKLQLLGQDISRSIYAQMECGSYNIRISELVALKEIYGISYDEFFKDIRLNNKTD